MGLCVAAWCSWDARSEHRRPAELAARLLPAGSAEQPGRPPGPQLQRKTKTKDHRISQNQSHRGTRNVGAGAAGGGTAWQGGGSRRLFTYSVRLRTHGQLKMSRGMQATVAAAAGGAFCLGMAAGACGRAPLPFAQPASSAAEEPEASRSDDPVLAELTAFAEALADATEGVVLQYFRSEALRGHSDLKKDLSAKTVTHTEDVERAVRVASYPDIVTEADKEAERIMRAMVEENYPSHAIIGEEFGVKGDPAKAEWCWIFDPIDGTADFVCGTHQWGTLIGLCKDGAPVIGVINQPASKDRWVGCRGTRTLHNGVPTYCAPCGSLATARLSASGCGLGALVEQDWVTCARALVQETRTASFGGPNAYGWGLLASGCIDVLLDASDSEIYDIAAAIPVVEGAGGYASFFR